MRPATVPPDATRARRTCLKKKGSRYIDSISTGMACGLLSWPRAISAAPCMTGLVGLNSSRMTVLSTATPPGSPRRPIDRMAWRRSCSTAFIGGWVTAWVRTSRAPSTFDVPRASAARRALSMERGLAESTSSIAFLRMGNDLSHAAARALPLFL